MRALNASAASGYAFANFSGDLTGTTTPQILTISGPKTVTANFNSVPTTSKITITSIPTGQTIRVDGTPITTPQDFTWTIASTHTIEAPSPQGAGFTRYAFDHWSTGQNQADVFTTPTAATTGLTSRLARDGVRVSATAPGS